MISLLRNKISEYVTRNADVNDWESVRELFGAYSYLAFLCMATGKISPVNNLSKVIEHALSYKLETRAALDVIVKTRDSEKYALDILKLV